MKKTMFVAVAVLAIILGIVAYATAATSTVKVTATVAPKLELSAPVGTYDMSVLHTLPLIGGALDPNEPALDYNFDANVKSNKGYSINAAWVGTPDSAYSFTFTGGSFSKGASVNHPATITFDPSFDTAPESALPAQLLFTATQP